MIFVWIAHCDQRAAAGKNSAAAFLLLKQKSSLLIGLSRWGVTDWKDPQAGRKLAASEIHKSDQVARPGYQAHTVFRAQR